MLIEQITEENDLIFVGGACEILIRTNDCLASAFWNIQEFALLVPFPSKWS